MTTTHITPASLLAAARSGNITAEIADAEAITPLAGGVGPEQYPCCTIELCLDGQPLLSVSGWKLVYYSTEGDPLNGGRGTYDFREVSSDGCTHGDFSVELTEDDEARQCIHVSTGEGMPDTDYLYTDGLSESEAEEVRGAIDTALEGAYGDWSPEQPSDEEIYAALVKGREDASVSVEIGSETVSVGIYAGTHCGQPQYAIEGDEDQYVTDSAERAALRAKEALVALLQEALYSADDMDIDSTAQELRDAVRQSA